MKETVLNWKIVTDPITFEPVLSYKLKPRKIQFQLSLFQELSSFQELGKIEIENEIIMKLIEELPNAEAAIAFASLRDFLWETKIL